MDIHLFIREVRFFLNPSWTGEFCQGVRKGRNVLYWKRVDTQRRPEPPFDNLDWVRSNVSRALSGGLLRRDEGEGD